MSSVNIKLGVAGKHGKLVTEVVKVIDQAGCDIRFVCPTVTDKRSWLINFQFIGTHH